MTHELPNPLLQFEEAVPFSGPEYLILKSHLVIERRLLEYIQQRVSESIFNELNRSREGSFQVRLLVARVLAEREAIESSGIELIWPALESLGALRNEVAHTLERTGTSLEDRMRIFIEKVNVVNPAPNIDFPSAELHRRFRDSAAYLNSLLSTYL